MQLRSVGCTISFTPALTDGATLTVTFTYHLSSLQSLVDAGLLYAYGLVKMIIYLIQYTVNLFNPVHYILFCDRIYFVQFLSDKNDTKISTEDKKVFLKEHYLSLILFPGLNNSNVS